MRVLRATRPHAGVTERDPGVCSNELGSSIYGGSSISDDPPRFPFRRSATARAPIFILIESARRRRMCHCFAAPSRVF